MPARFSVMDCYYYLALSMTVDYSVPLTRCSSLDCSLLGLARTDRVSWRWRLATCRGVLGKMARYIAVGCLMVLSSLPNYGLLWSVGSLKDTGFLTCRGSLSSSGFLLDRWRAISRWVSCVIRLALIGWISVLCRRAPTLWITPSS